MTTETPIAPKYIQTAGGEVYLNVGYLIDALSDRIFFLETAESVIQRLLDEVEADLKQAKESEAAK